MISGIDVNDGNKVPSSAYIHTLVDRIGMGTELSGFDNLTAAVNSVNNNLSNSRKIVQVATDDHGFSLGYEPDNGLYTLVDLTKFYLVSKDDLNNVSNKLMLDGMKTLSVKWVGGNTMEFYVDNTRVFGISAKWDGNYS